MEQKLPEKNTPSTIANAINRYANLSFDSIHFNCQAAFFSIHGKLTSAFNSKDFSLVSRIILSI
jgi:hypothetical protein